ncbi:DUF4062 domain-containing protein [Paenibacillus dendritiformis]|uniref:DUF4062 domain-containing protein n=1 Tax=Paenibacillus dendritiformis TaxID=130049 RepID=UPI00143CDCD2|nr:DUF4062 domain-containing protein [Paenibacillus dendritiformis]NKI21450.1 DUF4062 domain-containing protein [Paenibacillus dendritiformis]NRG01594.1 DUF4062 domain-containing protein [Paenibacillus dendritiformis]
MEKKLQVFVSSTYLDLIEERQKAVEGILRAGHIPAGMELFTAASKSQWNVIEEWIKESDILMLILGGKYGSTESESGKSYTHLEYEFALKHNIPVFAVVLSEQYLLNKKSKNINLDVFEREVADPQIEKYKEFKKLVHTNLIRNVNDINEIKGEVAFSLQSFTNKDGTEYNFKGWIRGTEINQKTVVHNPQNNKLFRLDETLLDEVINSIELDSFIDTIEYIATYCSYKSETRQKIDEFVYTYSQPSKRFFNEEVQTLFRKLLKSLDDYTNHLSWNFFPMNERQYLYPDLNIDLTWVDEKGRELYDKHLSKLSQISRQTIDEIRNFVHDSRVTFYK